MTKRIFITAILTIGLFGLTLMAESPFTYTWDNTLSFDPDGTLFLAAFESVIQIDYSVGSFMATSRSEFQRFGLLWQEFNTSGRLGGLNVQGDVLFGPSTDNYLYAQAIASVSIAGIDVGIYFAHLSDAVLGGAADGFAVRIAQSTSFFDLVSITELGARIADDDFDGITIVHAASGLSRSYITDPVVPGQGFTGEKVTISGLSVGCVEDIKATLYMTREGFDYILFELNGIDSGISWLTFDLAVKFEVQTKSVTLTPALVVGDVLCLTPYLRLVPTSSTFSIDGIILGGLDLTFSWNGVTLREVVVLAGGQYVITTPEYGSLLESIADAVENGHTYYAQYWELLSLEVDGEACCGGTYRVLMNAYFNAGAGGIFGWGMTYVEGEVGIGSHTTLSSSMTFDTNGVDKLGVGFNVSW